MTNPTRTLPRRVAERARRHVQQPAFLIGAAVAILVLLVLGASAREAFAANSATDVGRNLGGLLKTWATWLFGGATAIIAVTHLGRRDVAGALVFAGMAILVGGFVLAGPQVADFIKGIYDFADTGR